MTKYAKRKLCKTYQKYYGLAYAAELNNNHIDAEAFEELANTIMLIAQHYGFGHKLKKNQAMIRYNLEQTMVGAEAPN